MARYKHIDTNPRLLPVDLSKQLLPSTFEFALNHLLDEEIDLSGFDRRYRNDDTGATAYPPALLLKIILFAYSQGISSGRTIERAPAGNMSPSSPCAATTRPTLLPSPASSANWATTSAKGSNVWY